MKSPIYWSLLYAKMNVQRSEVEDLDSVDCKFVKRKK